MAGRGAQPSFLRSKKKVTWRSWLCCYTPCFASDEEYAPPKGPWSMHETHPDMAALSGMYVRRAKSSPPQSANPLAVATGRRIPAPLATTHGVPVPPNAACEASL